MVFSLAPMSLTTMIVCLVLSMMFTASAQDGSSTMTAPPTHDALACSTASAMYNVCAWKTANFTSLPFSRQAECLCYNWIARDTWFPSIFDDAMASCTAGSMVVSVDDQIAALTSAAPRAPAPCASMGNVASATASASDGLARLRERASSWDSASSTSSVSGLSGFPSVTATPGAGTSAGPTVVTAAETHEPSFTSSGSGASTGSHGSATSKGAAGQAADSGWVGNMGTFAAGIAAWLAVL